MSAVRNLMLILFIAIVTRPAMAAGGDVINGYAKYTGGEHIGYRSFHPYANSSLLTRCLDGKSTITWETDAVPQTATGESVTFVWVAAHSSGTSTADATFHLTVNGKQAVSFTTVKERRVRQWTAKGNDGITLSFDAKWEDSVNDLFGYMHLTVPVRLVTKGRPVTLGVTGENANRRDWYMTFKYAIKDSLAIQPQPALLAAKTGNKQLIDVLFDILGPGGTTTISVPGQDPMDAKLKPGFNRVQFTVNEVKVPTPMRITITRPGHALFAEEITLQPVRHRELWVIHHSHNDIGYSDLQVDVEKKQLKNLRDAVALFNRTAHYPKEARFKWNTEIMWAVDSYLATATEQEKKEFIDVVKAGGIGLNAFYTNQLTGICRPEELIRLTDVARRVAKDYGVTVNDAMISDIPGSTWATVAALAQGGIKYFSSGPNFFPGLVGGGDRVGYFNNTWGDRPFYWVSASGQEKVLFWVAGRGYSAFHGGTVGKSGSEPATKIFDYMRQLDGQHYPYDMVQLRYTIIADNGPTDPDLPDFVKEWNEKYVSPRFVVSTTSAMFEEFERRWGATLPSFAGDITPYWEDGALSTLRELSLVRRSTERMVQTEALACMTGAAVIPRALWDDAWRAVHLADEHTWGAHNSISDPDNPFAVEQLRVKKKFMTDTDDKSRALLAAVLGPAGTGDAIDVINTSSWNRTDLVVLTRGQSASGDLVTGPDGGAVPSQRLSSGELAFMAREIPALGACRYTVRAGRATATGSVKVQDNVLSNGLITVTLDRSAGTISSLKNRHGFEFVKAGEGKGLNQYLYVPGKDPAKAKAATVTKIEVVERGPLVGIVRVTSTASGCRSLVQEYRVIDEIERVDMVNTMDKEKIREKEAVHFAFPANPKDGVFRLDGGWGIVRPVADQLPGSCAEYFSTGRWLDISNQEYGLTWTTVETPLVQVGAMVDESSDDHGLRQWRKDVVPGSTFYSYAMNNYWHTNYVADQPGIASVGYALYPHAIFVATDAFRRGLEQSQPLIVRSTTSAVPVPATLFAPSIPGVVTTSVKQSTDGKAVMVRLFNVSGKPEEFRLIWKDLKPAKVYCSSVFETKDGEAGGTFSLPAFGILTLRCEK
jgi:hypothetical protein